MTLQLDSWFIVCLIIERVIVIFWPLHVKQIVTKKRVKFVMAVIFCVLLFWNIEVLYRYDIEDAGPYYYCLGKNLYLFSAEFFVVKDNITEGLTTSIPVIIVTLCNAAIFIKLYQIRRQRSDLQMSNTEHSGESMKLNVMIIITTFLFVVLLAPYSVYQAIHGVDSVADPVFDTLYRLTTVNPAINFYAYFLSASLFREEVLKWIRCKSCQRSPEGEIQGHSGSSNSSCNTTAEIGLSAI